MEELDEILLDQYHSAKKRKKIYKRIKKIMPQEPLVLVGEEMNDKTIQFIEYQIHNKQLLTKKHKKKKNKELDILSRNPIYEWYRSLLYMTVFSYKNFVDSTIHYMNYFKKDKNDQKPE